MSRIFKLSISHINASTSSKSEASTSLYFAEVAELTITPHRDVAGPELRKRFPYLFELCIPEGWQNAREKAIAALRRTIAGAALEISQEIKPSLVYVTDVDLCGLAGVLVSRSLGCPLVLGLSSNIEIDLFDERKVSILDASITAAKAVAVTGAKAGLLLKGYYPKLKDRIEVVEHLGIDDPGVEKLIKNVLHGQMCVPWTRKPVKSLPVSRPSLLGPELIYVEEVLRSGWWGYGLVAQYLEKLFAQYCGPNVHALAVSSCTAALHLAIAAARVQAGDEVIVPGITYVSTAAAVVHAGATPRFADIDPSTLTISPEAVERELSPRTRAIIPVHYAGVPADISSIEQLVHERSIVLIEDAAHAMGAERDGCRVGSRSSFTCFSFAPTKHVPSCGGGMLLFRDGSLTTQLRELSNLGLRVDTYQRSTQLGVAPANEVIRIGYKYRMDDVTAAIAVAQFERMQEILDRRAALVARYYYNLRSVKGIELIAIPESTKPSWYIMPIRVPASVRDVIRVRLASEGIDTSIHYPCLIEQPAFKDMPGNTPVASREAQRLISLPLHTEMTINEVDRVCEIIADYLHRT